MMFYRLMTFYGKTHPADNEAPKKVELWALETRVLRDAQRVLGVLNSGDAWSSLRYILGEYELIKRRIPDMSRSLEAIKHASQYVNELGNFVGICESCFFGKDGNAEFNEDLSQVILKLIMMGDGWMRYNGIESHVNYPEALSDFVDRATHPAGR